MDYFCRPSSPPCSLVGCCRWAAVVLRGSEMLPYQAVLGLGVEICILFCISLLARPFWGCNVWFGLRGPTNEVPRERRLGSSLSSIIQRRPSLACSAQYPQGNLNGRRPRSDWATRLLVPTIHFLCPTKQAVPPARWPSFGGGRFLLHRTPYVTPSVIVSVPCWFELAASAASP
ncbi:hypothetical protein VTK73DRAFT_4243 [Phialemonium thermophilum]|uniref:Uncharacterized protein n=1 Tax=Phialemonium thermophilum TaxID=223376 RepID=A0ABR3VAM8_9PEZI